MNKKYFLAMLGLALFATGCAVGPKYVRPDIDIATHFKEAPEGWQLATPKDTLSRGDWWQIWGDETLNGLVAQVAPANQTVAEALANYQQARAQIQLTRADFFPEVDLQAGTNRTRGSGDARKSLSLDASWELDFWGKTARSVEAATATAEARKAALASAVLSGEAELVQNYFALRILDKRKDLVKKTIELYEKTLTITQNQYQVGLVSRADVATANSQLKSAQAQWVELDLSRRQYEHAIAILIGKAPANFSLVPDTQWQPKYAKMPAVLPGDLLERRPDIAEAERQVMEMNARIGVAKAAFYPSFTLSASTGYGAAHFADLFKSPARVWSVGATLAETLFDAGARKADLKSAEAAYDASVAGYRGTVLTALREVEDNVAAIGLLAEQKRYQEASLASAKEASRISLNQYRAGITTFVTVASSQTTQFNIEQSLWQLNGQELSSQVLFIKAIGGSW